MINLLDNKANQTSKSRTKKWVEIIDDKHGVYGVNNQINLKLQCKSQVYVLIVMHTYLLKLLYN